MRVQKGLGIRLELGIRPGTRNKDNELVVRLRIRLRARAKGLGQGIMVTPTP